MKQKVGGPRSSPEGCLLLTWSLPGKRFLGCGTCLTPAKTGGHGLSSFGAALRGVLRLPRGTILQLGMVLASPSTLMLTLPAMALLILYAGCVPLRRREFARVRRHLRHTKERRMMLSLWSGACCVTLATRASARSAGPSSRRRPGRRCTCATLRAVRWLVCVLNPQLPSPA